jgi:preprotein translocase subunit SecE
MQRLINYFKETKIELKHVNWPTKNQTVNFTLLVIGISLGVSFFMGFFDSIFAYLLQHFVL